MRRSSAALLAASAALAHAGSSPWTCPPLGPVLPAARNASAHPAVRAALDAFAAGLRAETAGFDASAVSVGVKSALEDGAMLDFHFTPRERDPRGAQAVDRRTLYRVGSITKVFTVLAALQRADVVRWDDPVTKYVPELKGVGVPEGGELDFIGWEEVTVEALAGQISGVGGDMMTDGAAYPGNWTALGLPPLPEGEERQTCGGFGGLPACTREEFMKAFTQRRPPVYPAYHSTVYSNPGISLMGLVVEAATGKPFEQVLQEAILDPAGMNSTRYSEPPEDLKELFIAANDTIYDFDLGVFKPGGSMYSNTEDMLRFGDAVLRHRLLSPARTRRWLKPRAFTSAAGSFVGEPWEGFVSGNLTGDGRQVEVYTKSGDIASYTAGLALLPEYGLTVSVLSAGAEVTSSTFPYYGRKLGELLPPLVKALDEAARDEARARVAGTYADEASGSRMTLAVDGGWGLRVQEWVARGFAVVPNYTRYSPLTVDLPAEALPPDENRTARAYPTGLRAGAGGERTAWRVVFDSFDAGAARDEVDDAMFYPNASCVTWLTQDRLMYDYKGVDHLELAYGADGRVASVLPKAFAVELKRVEEE